MGKSYQQSDSYIPKSDPGFHDWLHNFASLIDADCYRYGLAESDAAVLVELDRQFAEHFNLVQSPKTRTTGLVTAKDAIKASAMATARMYAMQIKANRGIGNQDKIELGLRVNDPTPTPIPPPGTAPMLDFVTTHNGEHILRYADEATPNSRRKPPGVILMLLFMHVGDEPVTDYRRAQLHGAYGRIPIRVNFAPADAGRTVTYFGRWLTQRGLFGPWSLPLSMMIAFGGREHTESKAARQRDLPHVVETMAA